jgi:cobalt/nickel transport protein
MSRSISTRALVVAGVIVALLIAGVASFYASSDPDGLAKVSQDKGFSDTGREHDAAEGPFAGYETRGVDDARLSGGAAGVVGSLVVLAVAGGVVLLVRRRRPADVS